MNIIKTKLDGVLIIEPKVFGDARGYFFESYRKNKLAEYGVDLDFVQDNESMSSFGVLRGLHYQLGEFAQSKLVRVIQGRVLDVAVDIRKGSATFGQHISIELNADNKTQLFIPCGFAHGFVVLSDNAIFSYKCDKYYAPNNEAGIIYNDEQLNIDWKIDSKDIKISDKDKLLPQFSKAIL